MNVLAQSTMTLGHLRSTGRRRRQDKVAGYPGCHAFRGRVGDAVDPPGPRQELGRHRRDGRHQASRRRDGGREPGGDLAPLTTTKCTKSTPAFITAAPTWATPARMGPKKPNWLLITPGLTLTWPIALKTASIVALTKLCTELQGPTAPGARELVRPVRSIRLSWVATPRCSATSEAKSSNTACGKTTVSGTAPNRGCRGCDAPAPRLELARPWPSRRPPRRGAA